MKIHPRIPPILALAVLALANVTLNSGCVAVLAAGAGAGTVAYIRGTLNGSFDASFDRTLAAAQKAIEELKFAKVSEKKDALIATLVARNADDKRVEIRLDADGSARTTVKIRVGVLGDEALSMAILEKIKGDL